MSVPYYKADEAWVVTNSYFTAQASKLAVAGNIRLIDRDELIEMILKMNPAAVPSAKQIKDQFTEHDPLCPWCGKQLVKRFGRNGSFLGCKGYPNCKYTVPLLINENAARKN